MKKIKLTKGKFSLVDDEDFELVNKFNWQAHFERSNKSFYARRGKYIGTVNKLKKYETIRLHRFIMGIGAKNPLVVDHINHNTLDNRKSNLRICTNFDNSQNRNIKKLKGYCFDKDTGKYVARLKIKKVVYYLGRFKFAKDARKAYLDARRKF